MTTNFDPWTSTFEEAVAAQEAHADSIDPDGPIYRWSAAQELLAIEKKGLHNGFDVLAAVALCALRGLVMPDWLARAYLERYRAVQQLRADSWDDDSAFGRPYPKGAQVGAMRRRRLNRIKVALEVKKFISMHPELPLDPEWTRIGQSISKSDKEAQKLYSEAVKLGQAAPIESYRARYRGKRAPRK